MRLFLLHAHLRWEEKQILRAAEKHGLQVKALSPDSTPWCLQKPFPQDACFLMRHPGYFTGCRLASMLETMGHTVINRFAHLRLFGQKTITDHVLHQRGFPVIPSVTAFSLAQLPEIEARVAYPMVSKRCIGGFGRLVHCVESRNQLRQLWEQTEAFAPAHHRLLYLQPLLSVVHDIRVLLLNGTVLCTMARHNSGAFQKNVARGGRGVLHDLTHDQQRLMQRLGEWLPWGFFGVDLLVCRERGTFISEINAVCEFREATRVTGVQVAAELVAALSRHHERKRPCTSVEPSVSWAHPA